jgi:hypothetical protein
VERGKAVTVRYQPLWRIPDDVGIRKPIENWDILRPG